MVLGFVVDEKLGPSHILVTSNDVPSGHIMCPVIEGVDIGGNLATNIFVVQNRIHGFIVAGTITVEGLNSNTAQRTRISGDNQNTSNGRGNVNALAVNHQIGDILNLCHFV
jgi:hypothetical protein